MACFYHNEVNSVCSCNGCNKQLCRECTVEIGSEVACLNCFGDYISYQAQWLKKIKVRLIVGLILGVMFAFMIKDFKLMLISLCFITLPVTYYFMNQSPSPIVHTTFESLGTWMFIKMGVAFVIGPLMFPFIAYRYHNINKTYQENKAYYENLLSA